LRDDTTHLGVGPIFDLSHIRASARFDTVKIDVHIAKSLSVNTFRFALWRNPTITLDKHEGKRAGYAWCDPLEGVAGGFQITLHNVTRQKLKALHAVFEELGGLATEPMIHEAHFALDFRIKSKPLRTQFAEILPMIVNVNGVNLLGRGTPRIYVGKEASDFPGNLHLRSSTRQPYEDETWADVRPRFFQYNRMLNAAGTTYFGSEHEDRYIRIYHKVTDNKKPVPEKKQTVRMEQVFRRNSLEALGITTLGSLINFNAKKLAKKFAFEIGRVPSQASQLQTIRLYKTERLMRTGAFAVRESEGGPSLRRYRSRKATVALSPLQKKSSNAWRAFDKRWSRDDAEFR